MIDTADFAYLFWVAVALVIVCVSAVNIAIIIDEDEFTEGEELDRH